MQQQGIYNRLILGIQLDTGLGRSGPPTPLSHAPALQRQEGKNVFQAPEHNSAFNHQQKSSVLNWSYREHKSSLAHR